MRIFHLLSIPLQAFQDPLYPSDEPQGIKVNLITLRFSEITTGEAPQIEVSSIVLEVFAGVGGLFLGTILLFPLIVAPETLIGFFIICVLPFTIALTVFWTGNAFGQEGNFLVTWGSALLGISSGMLISLILQQAKNLRWVDSGTYSLVFMTSILTAPIAGSIIGYNVSISPPQRPSSPRKADIE